MNNKTVHKTVVTDISKLEHKDNSVFNSKNTLKNITFCRNVLLKLKKTCNVQGDTPPDELPITIKISTSCIKCSTRLGYRFRKPTFTWNYTKHSALLPLSFHFLLIANLVLFPALTDVLNLGTFSIRSATACHPGRYGGNRPIPRKMTPITYRQHVPNVSEKTIGASGPSEGKITRDSKRFREELKPNWNTNIVFKDEEQTNADRMMTERCRDRLNRLAIMVAEHWKSQVKLRVTEAWDEDGAHELDSLHYEGRAVDITTTDRDRSKYGMLARLAIEAGFDWVFYQSKAYIHCSVKSDNSDAARYGGCFAGDSLVNKPNGKSVFMSELKPGDSVLSVNSNGNIVEDVILTFMDRISPPITGKENERTVKFVQIKTESGKSISLTRNHLIRTLPSSQVTTSYHKIDESERYVLNSQFIYANDVNVGDYVFEAEFESNKSRLENLAQHFVRVASVTLIASNKGAFAPLTRQGTILVDGLVASCYAALENHKMAHGLLTPLRMYYEVRNFMWPNHLVLDRKDGVSWYPKYLHEFCSMFFTDLLLET